VGGVVILDGELFQPELVLAGVWSLVCFVAGVAWAAYRAVGWVERMRAWAQSPIPGDEGESL
jgi:hypothetical protein